MYRYRFLSLQINTILHNLKYFCHLRISVPQSSPFHVLCGLVLQIASKTITMNFAMILYSHIYEAIEKNIQFVHAIQFVTKVCLLYFNQNLIEIYTQQTNLF